MRAATLLLHVQERVQVAPELWKAPLQKCRGIRDVPTGPGASDAARLVPQAGSSLPGSQAGSPRQAKQSISTHRNPAAQRMLRAMKLQACWFLGQRAGELGAVFPDGPRVLELGVGGGQVPYKSQALIHSALKATG